MEKVVTRAKVLRLKEVLEFSQQSQVDAERKCLEAAKALASLKESNGKLAQELSQAKKVFWQERSQKDAKIWKRHKLGMIPTRKSVRR